MTIRELRAFLLTVPLHMDDFHMVNGEVFGIGDYYVRADKPIIHIEIDEENGEFLLLHQSNEEIESIIKEANGDTEGIKE
jgi:hypothetical protein